MSSLRRERESGTITRATVAAEKVKHGHARISATRQPIASAVCGVGFDKDGIDIAKDVSAPVLLTLDRHWIVHYPMAAHQLPVHCLPASHTL
jgi:hypothetical protein